MQRLALAVALLVIVAASVLGLGWLQRPAKPIRIGMNPWPGYEAFFLAHQRGLFARHGLDIHLVEFTSVGDCLRGFQQGDVDGMACTLIEVALARQIHFGSPDQIPVPVIVPDSSAGADVILAQPDITGVAGLAGRKVGVEPASLGVFIYQRALERHRVDPATITLVPLGQEAMAQAMQERRVDAIVTYPPYSIPISKAGARTVFTTSEIPDEIVDVIALSRGVLSARPELAGQLRAVWGEVQDLIAQDRTACLAAMAERQRITPAEFTASLEGITIYGAKDQDRLLAPGGAVATSLAAVERLLAQAEKR